MAVATEFRQRALAEPLRMRIELLENLPGESLVQAVEFLESLAHTALQASVANDLGVNEADLLAIIQHRLSPEEKTRLAYLRQQNETGSIPDRAHQEPLVYVDRVERQDGEWTQALIKLAQLPQVDLKVLVDEFLPTHQFLDRKL
jgi:hypothetical protein